MAIVENTLESIYDQLLYISGQNSSSVQIADAVRLFNYALNDYTHIALSSDGRWKASDLQDNGLNSFTTPIDGSSHYSLQASFVRIDRLEYTDSEGTTTVLKPIDRKDYKSQSLSSVFTGSKVQAYDLDGNVLTLHPNPSSGTLKIYPSLPFGHFTSATLTQSLGIPAHHAEFLVLYALDRLALRLSDVDKGTVRQELEIFTRKVRDDYSKRDEDTPRQLKGKVNVIE